MTGFSGSSWGVIGSRDLAPSWSPSVGRLVRALVENGVEVCTGSCPSGADAFVRSAWAVRVFRPGFVGPAALAARSAALVRYLAARPSSGLVAFVAEPCPVPVLPVSRWVPAACGTWSSVALAVALGLPAFVVWCAQVPHASGGPGAPRLPSWPGGAWRPVALPGGLSGWVWCAAPAVAVQLALL